MGLFDIFKKEQADSFDNTAIKNNAKRPRGSIVAVPVTGYKTLDRMFLEHREAYAHIEAAIHRNSYAVLHHSDYGVCVYDYTTKCLMPECFDPNRVWDVLSECHGPELHKVVTVSECIYNALSKKIKYPHIQICVQGVCYKARDFEPQLYISPATYDDVSLIKSTYYDVTLELIKDRIDTDNMFVGRLSKNGPVISYVGIHNDDSVGFEYVKPEHRRKHYGIEITDFMTDTAAKRGLIPYIQILQHNIASIRMNHNIGYQYHNGFIYWMFDEFE